MDNVDFSSRSGPNGFGQRLAVGLSRLGHILVDPGQAADVHLAFIHVTKGIGRTPIVQRLDGVWFNLDQDWAAMNASLHQTYQVAHSVIAQSGFDRKLIETFFGKHDGLTVIRNGTDVDYIRSLDPLHVPQLQGVERVWSCASSWRPHKRLAENVRYFREHAGANDCLIIAGANPDHVVADPRVFYAGDLNRQTLLQLYRSTDVFMHLAYLDHCPNVVVEARAAGCHIVCASSGGTEEVAGLDSTVIEEDEWDFQPCRLYEPPSLDFTRTRPGQYDFPIDIEGVTRAYVRVMEGAL